jgi:uncharacterized protein YkwD
VNNLRTLLVSTIAILTCACAGAILDTAAAQSPGTVNLASPTARVAARSAAKRRSHRACRASHHRRKGHSTCRPHRAHPGRSHATRNRFARRAHAGRRSHPATPEVRTETVSLSPEGLPTLAKVLATPCQNTELTPAAGNLREISAATLCLVNQERARNGELPLQVSDRLEEAAQSHSDEMVSENYFAHIAPSGLTPATRVQDTGYIPNPQVGYALGENLAWGTLSLSTPSAIVASWIASPEHLANILYSPYRDTAIGVAPAAPASLANGQPGAVYTQEFGVIIG